MAKEKQPKEFSKKIFNLVMFTFIMVIVFSMFLMWETSDTSPLAYIIPSIGGLATTCVGFYMWKSKAENILKIAQSKEDMENIKLVKEAMSEVNNMLDYDIQSEEGDY